MFAFEFCLTNNFPSNRLRRFNLDDMYFQVKLEYLPENQLTWGIFPDIFFNLFYNKDKYRVFCQK